MLAGALGEVMPLRRGDRVRREADADGKDAGKAVLGDRIAGRRRALEPGGRRRLVLGDAGAVEKADGVVDLRRRRSPIRAAEAYHCTGRESSFRTPMPCGIELRQRILGVGAAGLGGRGEKLRGALRVALAERRPR